MFANECMREKRDHTKREHKISIKDKRRKDTKEEKSRQEERCWINAVEVNVWVETVERTEGNV